MDEVTRALDYLEDRIGHVLRGDPVRDLDEAILCVRSIIDTSKTDIGTLCRAFEPSIDTPSFGQCYSAAGRLRAIFGERIK
jgi:hypothetical protein